MEEWSYMYVNSLKNVSEVESLTNFFDTLCGQLVNYVLEEMLVWGSSNGSHLFEKLSLLLTG